MNPGSFCYRMRKNNEHGAWEQALDFNAEEQANLAKWRRR